MSSHADHRGRPSRAGRRPRDAGEETELPDRAEATGSAGAPGPGPRSRRDVLLPALALSALALAALAILLALGARRDPLARARRALETADAYRVAGTVRVVRAGAASAELRALRGAGRAAGPLTITLGATDATGPDAPPSQTWRIAWPEVRDGAGRPIARRALGAVLPTGDPLGLLLAGHGARRGDVAELGGRSCRRVDFRVAARSYGQRWLAEPARMPVNGEAGGLWTFEGEGSAWLDEADGLPCRIRATVRLPRLADDRPGEAAVDWRYAWTRGP